MNRENFNKLSKSAYESRIKLSEAKSHDYSGEEDVLANFKRLSSAALALGLNIQSPIGYALFMSMLKMDRINNLLSIGLDPKNESIEDSFIDLMNYIDLAYALYKEKYDADL